VLSASVKKGSTPWTQGPEWSLIHRNRTFRRLASVPAAVIREMPMEAAALDEVRHRSAEGHLRWVRLSHWIIAASVLTLAVSGFVILMAHPRLYWGAVGNDLTPALFELPISRNYMHGGWAAPVTFFPGATPVVSAARTYDIFNENGWARSLHFLAAWFLVVTTLIYLAAGLVGGHVWRDLIPRARDLSPRLLWRDVRIHLRLPLPQTLGGPPYGLLQKLTYFGVVFLALPLIVVTGLTMSPAVTAAYPFLLDVFGGAQSARTIHFFVFAALVLFLIVHVAMVVLTGFKRQMRGMILGG
jgi:thiosulfate reductase cytochrome b subunit